MSKDELQNFQNCQKYGILNDKQFKNLLIIGVKF